MQVVEPREGARQIVIDEPLRAAQAFEPDLDEDAGRSLMFSRAAWISRGTCRSFDTTRRARSESGA